MYIQEFLGNLAIVYNVDLIKCDTKDVHMHVKSNREKFDVTCMCTSLASHLIKLVYVVNDGLDT